MTMDARYQLYLGALTRHRKEDARLASECFKFCKMASTYARDKAELRSYIDKSIEAFYSQGGKYNITTKGYLDAAKDLRD